MEKLSWDSDIEEIFNGSSASCGPFPAHKTFRRRLRHLVFLCSVLEPVQSYPWDTLPCISRDQAGAGTLARRAVARAIRVDAIADALGQLAVAEVRIVTHDISVARPADLDRLPLARAGLRVADDSVAVLVAVDPALAADVLRRVLARPIGLDDPRAPWSPSLQGAFEAVVVEVARQLTTDRALLVVPPVSIGTGAEVVVRATVSLDRRPYAAAALIRVLKPPHEGAQLGGAFPVEVPLVVGSCCTSVDEFQKLGVGDAWSCGDGWWIDAHGVGQGVLVGPGGELGVLVDLAQDGSIVVRDETRVVPIEEAKGTMDEGTEKTEVTEAVTRTVGETPVVVRVELGSVSLLAREWAELRPGDIIRSDQRVGEPVRLRIAGREVARGELVNVEGELGVRILSLTGESP